MKISFSLLVVALLLVACSKENNEPDVTEVEDVIHYKQLQGEYFQLLAFSKSAEVFAVKTDTTGVVPLEVIYQRSPDESPFYLWFNDGIPYRGYYEGISIFYSNLTQNSVDITLVTPDGQVEPEQTVEADFSWFFENSLLKGAALQQKDVGNTIKWVGYALNATTCVLGIVGSTSVPVLAPFAAAACVSTGKMLLAEVPKLFGDDEFDRNWDLVMHSIFIARAPKTPGDWLVLAGKFINEIEDATDFSNNSGVFVDFRDMRVYKWIKINDRIWMAENLKYKGANALSYNGDPSLAREYGNLYFGNRAREACPQGWRLPTQAEFISLVSDCGGFDEGGSALKEAGTAHWNSPNPGATNSSGFSALPGGWGNYNATNGQLLYRDLGNETRFWTSTPEVYAGYNMFKILRLSANEPNAFYNDGMEVSVFYCSIRCVKE